MTDLPSAGAQAGTESEQAALRSGTYLLLATLLARTPDHQTLAQLRAIPPGGDDGDRLQQAWQSVRQAAVAVDPIALDDEYHRLFIGLGRGELLPYGSWYQTGFLMEKPLSDLRQDLTMLGFTRQDHVREPEDHAALVCEVMAQLVQDPQLPFQVQQQFFDRHLSPWLSRFFDDMQQAPSAVFYRAVGRFGSAFTEFETRYLTLPV